MATDVCRFTPTENRWLRAQRYMSAIERLYRLAVIQDVMSHFILLEFELNGTYEYSSACLLFMRYMSVQRLKFFVDVYEV
jgi:hypothetical protein